MRRSWAALAVGALCSTLATGFDTGASAQSAVLTVAAYNIKHGRGADGIVDVSRIAADVRALGADVVTLQEVDLRTERTDRVDQTAVLAAETGTRGSFGAHRPYQGGEYGNAVLSGLPIVAARTHAIPPASGSALSVHEVQVEVTGFGTVSVVSVHLAGTPEERLAQADEVTRIFASTERPVVLAGDFNGRPDDPAVRRLAESWTIAPKAGPAETYPSENPDREIDFVMVRGGPEVEVIDHFVFAEPVASDHRPIVARLELRRPGATERFASEPGHRP